MKFIHMSDLHLGKIIYQRNLIDIQTDLLHQVINVMNQRKINTLVVAGDIYDRAIASQESVAVLNDFLDELINIHHKTVLMISGNHDSSERLNFASSLLKSKGLYIVSFPQKQMEPIEIEGVRFYLLPFFKPSYIRYLYDQQELKTYQEAFAYYLSQQQIDHRYPNVLVTHQFIAGNKAVTRSESEVILTVGGSEIIDVELVKDFDYVALGHIHASQKIKYDHVRYAGSLMKYSFDEVNQQKGIVEVTIEDDKVSCELVSLSPQRDLIKVSGYFHEILDYPKNEQDFVSVELKDHQIIGHAFDRLKEKYPELLQVTYSALTNMTASHQTTASSSFEKQTPVELFSEFYEKMKGEKPDEEDIAVIASLLKEEDIDDVA